MPPDASPRFDLYAAFQLGLSELDKEMRSYSLGGSDANIIVAGTDDDLCRLVRIKRGEPNEDDKRWATMMNRSIPVMLGIFTEPFNAWLYEELTRIEVFDRNVSVPHPFHDHYRCNLDGRVRFPSGETAIWEAKYSSTGNVAKLVERYAPQLQHNMDSAMENTAVLSIIYGGGKYEHFLVEADGAYIEALRARMDAVWRWVLTGERPDNLPDMPKAPMPDVLLRPDPVDLTTLPTANEIAVLAHEFLETYEPAKRHDRVKADLKKTLPGDAAEMFGFGICGTHNRKGSLTIVPDKPANDDDISY